MQQQPDVVHADLELVVWIVVVVITMVSQMIKAARQRPGRRAPGSAPDLEAPRPPRRQAPIPLPSMPDAQQELEEFLRSLTGQPPLRKDLREEMIEEVERPAAVPPPPMPVQAPTRPVVAPPAQPLQMDEGRVTVLRQETPPEARPARRPSLTRQQREAAEAQVGSYEVINLDEGAEDVDHIRVTLLDDLRDVTRLRKAIVLRELLSPPVTMRRGADQIPGLST